MLTPLLSIDGGPEITETSTAELAAPARRIYAPPISDPAPIPFRFSPTAPNPVPIPVLNIDRTTSDTLPAGVVLPLEPAPATGSSSTSAIGAQPVLTWFRAHWPWLVLALLLILSAHHLTKKKRGGNS